MKLRTIFAASIGVLALVGCSSPSQTESDKSGDRQRYSDAYKQVSEAMVSSQGGVRKKGKRPDAFSSYDEAYLPTDPGTNVLGTSALVYFLHLVYDNASFPITLNPVSFDCDWVLDGKAVQENTISMVSSMDEEQGIIVCDVYGDSHMVGQSESLFYINVNIDYDFAASEVVSFRLDMVGIKDGVIDRNGNVLISKYEHGQFETAFDQSALLDGKSEYLDLFEETCWMPYAQKLKNAVKADAEFSAEYGESMELVYPNGLPY